MGIRRDKTDVYHDILESAITPVRKTRLVYGSNLNFEIIKKYIIELTTSGLLEQNGNFYTTTEKGRKYIKAQESLTKLSNVSISVCGTVSE